MNNYSSNDIERVIKLVSEYTLRLKELINVYQFQRRNRLNSMFLAMVGLTIGYGILFFYLQFENSTSFLKDTSLVAILIIGLTIFVLFVYTFFNYQKGRRNYRDIKDEAKLIKKQLLQLIRIASQTREHLVQFENLALLEIDLKLTEAEDMVERANRVFYIDKDKF